MLSFDETTRLHNYRRALGAAEQAEAAGDIDRAERMLAMALDIWDRLPEEARKLDQGSVY